MSLSFGALYVAGNTTPTTAQADGNKITGWTAAAASPRGNQAVEEDTTNSRLVAGTDGVYEVAGQVTLELEDISGTSGDDAGDVYVQVFKNGAAVAGMKAGAGHADSDKLQSVAIASMPIELSKGDYVELCLVSADASGNDATVKEAQFSLKLLG